MIRRCVGLSLMLSACAGPPGPRDADAGDVVVLPAVSSPSSARKPPPAYESGDAVPDVALAHQPDDPQTHCYCASLFATPDLHSKRLRWTGAVPALPPSSLLLVTDIARMQCAIPVGAGQPSFVRVIRVGADVEVDLRWFFEGPVTSAAFVPAPAPGGRIITRLHGSWMPSGDTAAVETCEVTR